jgi:Outer membrane protein beta-barrel domain
MRKKIGTLCFVTGAIAAYSSIVYADSGDLDKRFYIIPQISRMDVDLGEINVDIEGTDTNIGEIDGDLLNPGILFGYKLNKNFALEGQYLTTIASSNAFGGYTDIDVEKARSTNLYGVYRSSGKVYLKLRAGMSYTQVDVDVDRGNAADIGLDREDVQAIEKLGDAELEFSYGLGVGIRFSSVYSMELEANRLTDDIYLYGINFKFDL